MLRASEFLFHPIYLNGIHSAPNHLKACRDKIPTLDIRAEIAYNSRDCPRGHSKGRRKSNGRKKVEQASKDADWETPEEKVIGWFSCTVF